MSNRIFIRSRGGRISVKQLGIVCKAAIKNQIKEFRISSRQEIVIDIEKSESFEIFLEELQKNEITFCAESKNLVSSLLSVGIFSTTPWLTHGAYLKVINDFPDKLIGTASFVDPKQEYVPLLESDYNFIADSLPNYWYLVVKKKNVINPFFVWPVRIGTDSIPEFIKTLDDRLEVLGEENLMMISEEINTGLDFDNLSYLDEFALPTQHYNLLDGLSGLEPQTLFFFADNYRFTLLDALLSQCNSAEIDFIHLSPWKSLVIAPIHPDKKAQWLSFLNWQNIKTGRGYQDLCWRLEIPDKKSLKLKSELIASFYKLDLRLNGLSFSICNDLQNAKHGNFIIKICKNKFLWLADLYDLIEVDKKSYKTIGVNLSLTELKNQLSFAIKNHQKSLMIDEQFNEKKQKIQSVKSDSTQYVCKDCQTLYVEEIGDPAQGVKPYTKFKDLTVEFLCPTCGNSKEDFLPHL